MLRIVSAAIVAMCCLGHASAAVVTWSGSFTATDFSNTISGGDPVPDQVVTATYSITYDDAVLGAQTPIDLYFTLDTGVAQFDMSNSSLNEFVVKTDGVNFEMGGNLNGPSSQASYTNDFYLLLRTGRYSAQYLLYSHQDLYGGVETRTFSFSDGVTDAVPLPAAAILFGPGLAGLALLRRRNARG